MTRSTNDTLSIKSTIKLLNPSSEVCSSQNKVWDMKECQATAESSSQCFLCLQECHEQCQYCGLVYYCSKEHFSLHRQDDYCFPFRAGTLPDKGRVLFATRDIRPLELILIDPGTVVGPNYKSEPVCLQCLRMVTSGQRCRSCRFPVCSEECAAGKDS